MGQGPRAALLDTHEPCSQLGGFQCSCLDLLPKVLTQLAWGLAPASYFKNSSGISNMQPRLRTMELEETEIEAAVRLLE